MLLFSIGFFVFGCGWFIGYLFDLGFDCAGWFCVCVFGVDDCVYLLECWYG